MELRRKRLEKLRVAEAHLIAENQANMKGRKHKIETLHIVIFLIQSSVNCCRDSLTELKMRPLV